jgi:cytochrome oxidase assembly protein ShyY1
VRVVRNMNPPTGAAAIGTAGRFFFGSLCVGTGALGVWQTQRYFEKQALIAQRLNDWQQAPMPYHDYIQQLRKQRENAATTLQNNSAKESLSLRRLQLTGRFRHDAEMFVGPRGPPSGGGSYSTGGGGGSQPSSGYYIVTPFEMETTPLRDSVDQKDAAATSAVLLVNRGWIPRHLLPHHAPPLDPTLRGPGHHQDYPYRHDKHYRHRQDNDNVETTHATNATVSTVAETTAPWSRPTGTVQLTVVSTPAEGRYTKKSNVWGFGS